jgi:hypothetical protein
VVELPNVDLFPVNEVVAGEAVLSKPSLVLIFVASDASGRNSEIRVGWILDLDGGAFLGRDARRIVALVASQAGMLAFQYIAGVLVIEGVDVPLDQRKIHAIMIGVAAGALLA